MSTSIWQKSPIFEKKRIESPHDHHSRCSASTAKTIHGKFSFMNILTSNIFRPIKTLYVKSRFLRQIMATTKDGQFQRMTAVGAEHRLRWHGGPLLHFFPIFSRKSGSREFRNSGTTSENRKKCKRRFIVAARRSRVATWGAGFLSDFPLKINVDSSDRKKNA